MSRLTAPAHHAMIVTTIKMRVGSRLQPKLKLVREEPANGNVAERWSSKARLWVFLSSCLGLWLLVDLITDIFVR
jgi:hypothetical protein